MSSTSSVPAASASAVGTKRQRDVAFSEDVRPDQNGMNQEGQPQEQKQKQQEEGMENDRVERMTKNLCLAFDVVFGYTEEYKEQIKQEIQEDGNKSQAQIDKLLKKFEGKARNAEKDELRELKDKIRKEGDLRNKEPELKCTNCNISGKKYAATNPQTGDVFCLRCRQIIKPNPHMWCFYCGEKDESYFRLDEKTGDEICTRCGAVLRGNQLKDEDWARVKTDQDTGEVKSTMGDAPLPYRSDAFNLGTKFSIRPGVANSKMKQYNRILQNAEKSMHRTEGTDGTQQYGQTREYYKDSMKGKEFRRMEHVGEKLRLSQGVIDRAQFYFSQYRDNREKLHQKEKAVAACMIAAFEDLDEPPEKQEEGKETQRWIVPSVNIERRQMQQEDTLQDEKREREIRRKRRLTKTKFL